MQELAAITSQNIKDAQSLLTLPGSALSHKPAPGAWSALECLEHLNLYAAFYHPEIEKALLKNTSYEKEFSSGIIGNMLVSTVKPGEKIKKMKTFAAMDPSGSKLGYPVIATFIKSQEQLLDFLHKAEKANLNKGGVPVTFTRLIALRLGDILRFMAYHNHRHIQQALRAVSI